MIEKGGESPSSGKIDPINDLGKKDEAKVADPVSVSDFEECDDSQEVILCAGGSGGNAASFLGTPIHIIRNII